LQIQSGEELLGRQTTSWSSRFQLVSVPVMDAGFAVANNGSFFGVCRNRMSKCSTIGRRAHNQKLDPSLVFVASNGGR